MGKAGQTGSAYENAPAMATHFVSVNSVWTAFPPTWSYVADDHHFLIVQ
jgi:hypothetical protein